MTTTTVDKNLTNRAQALASKRYDFFKTRLGKLFEVYSPVQFLVTNTLVISALYYWVDFEYSLIARLGLIVLGIFTFSFIEYCFHRFCFHDLAVKKATRKYFQDIHLPHHHDLNSGVNATPFFFFPILALYFAVAYGFTWNSETAAHLTVGASIGCMIYEIFHYYMHESVRPLRYMDWMTELHAHHHSKNWKVNFGITSPLWDKVFGTFKDV